MRLGRDLGVFATWQWESKQSLPELSQPISLLQYIVVRHPHTHHAAVRLQALGKKNFWRELPGILQKVRDQEHQLNEFDGGIA